MNNQPLISVIIPAYNAEKYLKEALDSVLSQTYQNWECIIIDDGSTDDTQKIVQDYITQDKRFIYFFQKNQGLSAARNSGIKIAKADYIAFLDSDDIWLPIHIESLQKAMIQYNPDMVFSYAYGLYGKNFSTKPVCGNAQEKLKEGYIKGQYRESIELFLEGSKATPSFTLLKKNTLVKNNNFSYHKKAEDFHTWLKLLLNNCTFYNINQPTGYYRVLENSMSSTDRVCTRELIDIISFFKQDIINKSIDYNYYFSLWARPYFLLHNDKTHYITAIKYINSYESMYFSLLKNIASFLPKKILKILALIELKYK